MWLTIPNIHRLMCSKSWFKPNNFACKETATFTIAHKYHISRTHVILADHNGLKKSFQQTRRHPCYIFGRLVAPSWGWCLFVGCDYACICWFGSLTDGYPSAPLFALIRVVWLIMYCPNSDASIAEDGVQHRNEFQMIGCTYPGQRDIDAGHVSTTRDVTA